MGRLRQLWSGPTWANGMAIIGLAVAVLTYAAIELNLHLPKLWLWGLFWFGAALFVIALVVMVIAARKTTPPAKPSLPRGRTGIYIGPRAKRVSTKQNRITGMDTGIHDEGEDSHHEDNRID